jgi:hypothetical protein
MQPSFHLLTFPLLSLSAIDMHHLFGFCVKLSLETAKTSQREALQRLESLMSVRKLSLDPATAHEQEIVQACHPQQIFGERRALVFVELCKQNPQLIHIDKTILVGIK